MGLKEFRDDWETWSKGKKIVSVIIGCCVLTFVLAFICGTLTPDANDYTDTTSDAYNDVDPDAAFYVKAKRIPVESSSIEITDQQTESSTYAYFYQGGGYAEPAYTTYTAEDINIVIDMNNITLSNDSILDYSGPFNPDDTYNQSHLVKDISKLIKSDDASISLDCYDKKDNYIKDYTNLKASMKKGILTLTFSDSETSDYHTKYSDAEKIDYAVVKISGTLSGKNATRDVEFDLSTKHLKVNSYV